MIMTERRKIAAVRDTTTLTMWDFSTRMYIRHKCINIFMHNYVCISIPSVALSVVTTVGMTVANVGVMISDESVTANFNDQNQSTHYTCYITITVNGNITNT